MKKSLMTKFDSSLARLQGLLEQEGVSSRPIIVLGMHRSGTTMLVQVLQRAGVFMGSRLSGNLEPRVFQDANRQIFDFFGAGWLDADLVPPPGILYQGFSGLAMGIADRLIDDLSPCFFNKTSPQYKHWGFKDPRTSVTAGLFLRLFPNAQALFIYRDPLDVAASIVTREIKLKRKYPGKQRFEFSEDDMIALIIRSVKLWETYNERALNVLPFFTSHAALRYESVLAAPEKILTKSLASLGLAISTADVSAIGISRERSGSALNLSIDLSGVRRYIAESKVANLLLIEPSSILT